MSGHARIRALQAALEGLDIDRLQVWGELLAGRLSGGARLLVAGNGGSAAEAQHLTSELVGRFTTDRAPLSAIALHADTSSMTAIANDYGHEQVYARQVRAHARPGDVLLLLSTSGASPNLLAAARSGRELGLIVWALTGPAPNPLADTSDHAVTVNADHAATVQECHLVAVHVLCSAIDAQLAPAPLPPGAAMGNTRRLVVVGDALLDRDITGLADRLSPEAPVPIVSRSRTVDRPGGAAMAAVLAARDPGWLVTLVCGIGQDQPGARLRALLHRGGVEVIDLALTGPTPVKTRVRAGDRTLLRYDTADEQLRLGPLPDLAQDRLDTAAAVLVCDYGRGVTSRDDVRAALSTAGRRVPLVWDPHPNGAPPVSGTTLAVPNSAEARILAGSTRVGDLLADTRHGVELRRLWPVGHVAVTRDRRGALLVTDPGSHPLVIPAQPAVGDSCGAGDQFAVTTATELGRGRLPSQALTAAVEAASAFIQAGGPASIATAEEEAAAPDLTSPLELAGRVRVRGGTVVGAGGCFDLLHAGHLALLIAARRLGDALVVCINSDASIRRLKGEDRPIVGERERAALLTALDCVDAVLVFDEDTPAQVLAELRPDIWVKGGDYAGRRVSEADQVESWGGQVVVVPYLEGHSTTERIADLLRQPR